MTRSLTTLLALAIAGSMATAHGAQKPSPPPMPSAAGTADAEHQRLAALAGLWNVKQSLWLTAGAPPQVDAGTALFTVVLGGRALQQDLRVSSTTAFQGLGLIGYDTISGTCFSSWMDVNLTDLLVLRGARDADRNTWRFSGHMRGADGAAIPTRETLQLLDAQHLLARYYETRDGAESLVVELAYSRP